MTGHSLGTVGSSKLGSIARGFCVCCYSFYSAFVAVMGDEMIGFSVVASVVMGAEMIGFSAAVLAVRTGSEFSLLVSVF